ncbi:MAG: LuxR C-terminal-related transcriptional regulator [Candidatus Baltobacteraceae bacterium]
MVSRVLAASSEESALQLYQQGRLEACLRRTAGTTSTAERIVRVRALIRQSRYVEALDVIAGAERATPEEEALLLALKSACQSLRGAPDLARTTLAALRRGQYAPETQLEIAYARMLIAWVEDDPDAMSAALHNVDGHDSPDVYGRWLYSLSWVAARRGEYNDQLRLLQAATAHIAKTPEAQDVFLLASATRALVHLVREIYAGDAFDSAVRIVESMPWTEDLEAERFLTFRGLAWAYALRGQHQKAYQYAYFARDIAPSAMWVAASYADQAYLARMAGENRSADALLDHAVACAKETNWTTRGEERVALLNLAELSADRDPATARALLAIYDSIPATVHTALALAHDSRLTAMEEYTRGTVLAVTGDRQGAIEQLNNAYATFATLGYAWRAAASALRLHTINEQDRWLQLASEAVRDFPESSVANEIRKKASSSGDPRVAALTPAQRRVFALMCEGLSDKVIAQTLRISPETVKNHAARVRGAFGVRSRAALIASTHALERAV